MGQDGYGEDNGKEADEVADHHRLIGESLSHVVPHHSNVSEERNQTMPGIHQPFAVQTTTDVLVDLIVTVLVGHTTVFFEVIVKSKHLQSNRMQVLHLEVSFKAAIR